MTNPQPEREIQIYLSEMKILKDEQKLMKRPKKIERIN